VLLDIGYSLLGVRYSKNPNLPPANFRPKTFLFYLFSNLNLIVSDYLTPSKNPYLCAAFLTCLQD